MGSRLDVLGANAAALEERAVVRHRIVGVGDQATQARILKLDAPLAAGVPMTAHATKTRRASIARIRELPGARSGMRTGVSSPSLPRDSAVRHCSLTS